MKQSYLKDSTHLRAKIYSCCSTNRCLAIFAKASLKRCLTIFTVPLPRRAVTRKDLDGGVPTDNAFDKHGDFWWGVWGGGGRGEVANSRANWGECFREAGKSWWCFTCSGKPISVCRWQISQTRPRLDRKRSAWRNSHHSHRKRGGGGDWQTLWLGLMFVIFKRREE